jgi:hypothetical protein
MNEQNKDNQNDQSTDLEPNTEVVGGAGFGYAVLTVGTYGRQTTASIGATLQIQGNITLGDREHL